MLATICSLSTCRWRRHPHQAGRREEGVSVGMGAGAGVSVGAECGVRGHTSTCQRACTSLGTGVKEGGGGVGMG
eukprot:361803-Chlamydomonas_euryale.AAC.1